MKLQAGAGVSGGIMDGTAVPTQAGDRPMALQRLSHMLSLLAVLGLALGLVACNTIEGAGKDVSATGRAVSNTAEETKQGL